jgi:hypothetical protein
MSRRRNAQRSAAPEFGRESFSTGGWVLIGLTVALIIAGIVAIVVLARGSSPDAVTEPVPVPTGSIEKLECPPELWYDVSINSCLPRTECAPDQAYNEEDNTCSVVTLRVSAIAPPSGLASGGTEVRISGSAFQEGATVTIGGTPAQDVVVVDSATLTAVTPASESLFPVDVTITNPDGEVATLDNSFTFVASPVDRIALVNPDTGSTAGGEAVIIKGVDFVDGAVVAFGGRPASDVVVLDSSTIRATTPAGAVGPVNVNVRNPGEAAQTLSGGFAYVDQAPRIVAGVKPVQGAEAGGTKVTITGSGFEDGAVVTFGSKKATKVKVVSSTKITAVSPKGALGSVTVGVRNPGVPAALRENAFEYVEAPTITGIRPADGPASGGSEVTITGTGFLDGVKVTIGGEPATAVKTVSDTRITARAPAGEEGATVAVAVTNPGQPTATAPKAFTYTAAAEPTPLPSGGPGTTAFCPSYALPEVSIDEGKAGGFGQQALFPASLDVKTPVLTDATFKGSAGGGDTLDWKAKPPRIVWQPTGGPGTDGTITFSYTAANCSGSGEVTLPVSVR